MKKQLLLLVCCVCLGFFGCDDDDDSPSSTPVDSESSSMLIDATNYSRWVYFSFEAGDTIQVSDPSTSKEWDLALMRSNLRTNSGTSGNALGGVYNAGTVGMSSILQAPESGYVVDDSIEVYDHDTHSYKNVAGSLALAGWLSMDMSAMPPTVTYTDSIYVIKTAKGNYAKIHVTDYYGGDGTASAMIAFDYVYQPDGSTTFSK